MDHKALALELAAPAYDKMTIDEAAAALNAPTVEVPRGVVSSHEVVAVLVAGDRNKIDPTDLQWLTLVLSAGSVDVGNANVRDLLISILAASTGSKDGIIALSTITISRAEELGLGEVTPADVKMARGGRW